MPHPPRLVTAFGEARSLKEWAARLGVSPETIRCRLDEFGWPPEKAVSTPAQAKFRPGGRPTADGVRPCPVPRERAGHSYCEWKHLGRRHCRSFGPWGSDEAANYRRFAAAWVTAGPGSDGASVAHLLTRWLADSGRQAPERDARPAEEAAVPRGRRGRPTRRPRH